MTEPSKTPRTDAAAYDTGLRDIDADDPSEDMVVSADFARSLELALTAAESALAEARASQNDLTDVLRRNGFIPCDNCGSWHRRYGLPERWQELKDAIAEAGHPLTNENGNLLRNALRALIAERDDVRAEAERLRKDTERVRVAVFEFINDWRKGDFVLPTLAKLDVQAIIAAYESIDAAMRGENDARS